MIPKHDKKLRFAGAFFVWGGGVSVGLRFLNSHTGNADRDIGGEVAVGLRFLNSYTRMDATRQGIKLRLACVF